MLQNFNEKLRLFTDQEIKKRKRRTLLGCVVRWRMQKPIKECKKNPRATPKRMPRIPGDAMATGMGGGGQQRKIRKYSMGHCWWFFVILWNSEILRVQVQGWKQQRQRQMCAALGDLCWWIDEKVSTRKSSTWRHSCQNKLCPNCVEQKLFFLEEVWKYNIIAIWEWIKKKRESNIVKMINRKKKPIYHQT